MRPPRWTLNELALAYELRQEGCSWKRIATGLGGDTQQLKWTVEGVVRNGITRHMSGYKVQSGRRPGYKLALIKAADKLRSSSMCWRSTAEHLGVDCQSLRRAHRYAKAKGLLAD